MITAKSLTSLAIVLSAACAFASTGCPESPAPTYSCRSQISFAQTFAGGQDVVHITKSDSRRTPFMDVKASDLLISYVYDKKGHLIDRKVWFTEDRPVAKHLSL